MINSRYKSLHILTASLILLYFLAQLKGTHASDLGPVPSEYAQAEADNESHSKVSLEDVGFVITLRKGQLASSRKGVELPQLNCIGSNCLNEPESITCYFNLTIKNTWWCNADAHSMIVEIINVTCEDYDYDNPEGPYILNGSCRLTYSLALKPTGLDNIVYVILLIIVAAALISGEIFCLLKFIPNCRNYSTAESHYKEIKTI